MLFEIVKIFKTLLFKFIPKFYTLLQKEGQVYSQSFADKIFFQEFVLIFTREL